MANVGFSAKYLKQRYGVSQTWFEADFPDFTPNLDRLAHQGLHLTRHYSYTSCTPSRASFLSGRLPVHLGVILGSPLTWDGGSDPTSGYDGLSPNMTIIPRIMRELGYRTHLSGKADGLGMATRNHVPAGRGFESALGYFNHANDFYNYTVGPQEIAAQYPCQGKIVTPFNGTDVIDQWEDFHNANRPPAIYAQCDKSKPKNCPYEDDVLTNEHSPLFLVAALHNPHTPLEAPPIDYVSQFCNSTAVGPFRGQCDLQERNLLLQMMAYVDRQIARIESAIKAKPGMWENTLLLFVSDNGGGTGVGVGGNVFPFRGGKGSDWEGGYRVPAFLAGGFLPPALAGTTYDEIVAIKDWFATFCRLGGGRVCTGLGADPSGDAVGQHPVESINLWPYLTREQSGKVYTSLQLGPTALLDTVDGVLYKYINSNNGYNLLTSTLYPNCTLCNCTRSASCNVTELGAGQCCPDTSSRPLNPAPIGPPPLALNCTFANGGCAYRIEEDYTESNNLCAGNPTLCARLQDKITVLNVEYYEPFRGCQWTSVLCPIFQQAWNLTYGTFLNDPLCQSCIFTTAAYFANPSIPKTTNSCQCNVTPQSCEDVKNGGLCVWLPAGRCESRAALVVPPQLVEREMALARAQSANAQINTGNI